MKQRFLALLLVLGLTVGLAACGGEPAAGEVSPSPDITVSPASPIPEDTQPTDAPVTDTQAPEETPSPDATEGATQAPDVTDVPDKGTPAPAETSAPTAAATPAPADTATPSPTPAPTPDAPAASATAADVYAAVAAAAGETSATMDASAVFENFYNLSTDDLEDFAFYLPELSAYTEEFFIGHAKSGKVDAVKAACQSRLDGLKEEGAFYPATALYLDDAKIVTQGDWVLLCVCPDAAGAVKAFQDSVK